MRTPAHHEPSWSSLGMTNTGRVRRHNEDALLERPEIGLWVVADGMGGHDKGDVASQMICQSLKEIGEGISLPGFIDDIEDKMADVNTRLIDKASQYRKQVTIGSTIVAMVAYQHYCVYIWAGDSRLYRLRDNAIRQLTTDHSQVEVYVEQGLITREEAAVHPHGNMITRAVGATDPLFLDMDIQEMNAGDRFCLCSDGLTKHMADLEIGEFMKTGTVEDCCQKLINTTLERGAGDNVTAIIIDIT